MAWTYLMLSAAIACTDEAIKCRIKNPPVKNTGFAMNRFDRHRRFVAAVSLLMTAGCAAGLFLASEEKRLGFSLLLGGALSNTYDRLVRKYVVDYIPAGRIYYNLSDVAVFAGSAVLTINSLSGEGLGSDGK